MSATCVVCIYMYLRTTILMLVFEHKVYMSYLSQSHFQQCGNVWELHYCGTALSLALLVLRVEGSSKRNIIIHVHT